MPGVESVACPSLTGFGAGSWVNDISADGHTVVGSLNDLLPMRWVDGVAQPLGPLPPEFQTTASAKTVVADGSVILGDGYFYDPSDDEMWGAFIWTPETGIQVLPLPGFNPVVSAVSEDLGVISGSQDWSLAALWVDGVLTPLHTAAMGHGWDVNALSANGAVRVGLGGGGSFDGPHAMRWDAFGPTDLMASWLAVGDKVSTGSARGVSPDGAIVVGGAQPPIPSPGPWPLNAPYQPVRWDGATPSFLDTTGFVGGEALDLSADAARIVGIVRAPGPELAALWDQGSLRLLGDELAALDLDLSGWSFQRANSVSDDGWTLAGLAAHDGVPQGFVAVLTPRVGLDIQPGSASNFVVLRPNGSLSVVLYGSDQVHVPTLNLADVGFGPAHAPVAGGYLPQDMNGDGHPDIVLFFATAATGLAIGDTEACLTADGAQPFRVCGPVAVTTGNCGLGFEAGLALLPLMLWRRRLQRAR